LDCDREGEAIAVAAKYFYIWKNKKEIIGHSPTKSELVEDGALD